MNASRLFFCCVACFAAGLFNSDTSWAETWSDSTGKFSVEAEFVGVEGANIVLRKADGKTLKVPIDRLSAESKANAKRLYEMNKSGGAAPEASVAPAAAATPNKPPMALSTRAPARALNFTPPALPTIPPLAPFPEDASLQETVDFVQTQLLAGHPEVFWHALPTEIRQTIDGQEFRNKLNPFMEEQAATSKQVEGVVMKAIEVLVTKKEFMLNSPLMAQVPPPMVPTVQQAYDPAVGLIYELSMMSFDNKNLADRSIADMFDDHGPRIGAHLQALVKMSPPGVIDKYLSQVVVDESDSTGTITVPNKEGGTDSTEMVKYAGRWLPKELAESWQSSKDGLVDKMVDGLNLAKQQSEATGQQPEALIGMFAMMANSALDPMLAATTQAEFDQAIMGIMAMLPNMNGNVGPGGAGAELNPGF